MYFSAAHCMNPKSYTAVFEKVKPKDIRAMPGAYNLSDPFEVERMSLSPLKIIIHEEWNPLVLSYDADLAMLVLEKELHFTRYIQQICLWTSENPTLQQEGVSVGWGRGDDESIFESIPKEVTTPIHLNEVCFLKKSKLAEISSLRTFCGGSGDGTGVCHGDSGNGLFVKVSNIFYLKGIVSSSLLTQYSCDVSNYAVYNNIDKYQHWIHEKMGAKLSTGNHLGSIAKNNCFLPNASGNCRGRQLRYYYDKGVGICKQFYYTGCTGNGNNFNTFDECESICGNAVDLCTLPPIYGRCNKPVSKWFYDRKSEKCKKFIFTGCEGNKNNFHDKKSCKQACKLKEVVSTIKKLLNV